MQISLVCMLVGSHQCWWQWSDFWHDSFTTKRHPPGFGWADNRRARFVFLFYSVFFQLVITGHVDHVVRAGVDDDRGDRFDHFPVALNVRQFGM